MRNEEYFAELKEICRLACHERKACREGFEALMRAETVPQIMQVWKNNWDDVFRSRYADIVVKKLDEVNPDMIAELRAGGVYVNADSEEGYVIISHPERPVNVGGTARAYIFTPAVVSATDNAQVYCRTGGSRIVLHGHSYCRCDSAETMVSVFNFAKAEGVMQCHTYNAAEVTINGGRLCDSGHRRIAANGGTMVYSNFTKGITLGPQCRQFPFNEQEAL